MRQEPRHVPRLAGLPRRFLRLRRLALFPEAIFRFVPLLVFDLPVPGVALVLLVLFDALLVGVPQVAGALGHAGDHAAAHLLEPLVDRFAHFVGALLFLGRQFFLPFLAPLPLEAGEAGGVLGVADGVAAGLDAAIGGEAGGRAVAQEEHEQAVVVDGAFADELAVGIDRHVLAVEGAVHRHVFQLLDAQRKRGLPGLAELAGLGVAA